MMPFFFGTENRRLFGAYEAGATNGRRTSAVLICQSWGAEYLHAHRAMRRLAAALAGTGRHTLRFDYFGSGDSAGETSEGNLAGWRKDVETALEEIKDMAQTSRVSVVGLRMGATLAAEIATKCGRDIESLVLWDPVVSGSEYIQDLHREADSFLRRKGLKREPLPTGAVTSREILGFRLTDALAREIAALDLGELVPKLPRRTLMIETQGAQGSRSLDAALARSGRTDLSVERIESFRPWLEDLSETAGAIPTQVIQRIVTWYG